MGLYSKSSVIRVNENTKVFIIEDDDGDSFVSRINNWLEKNNGIVIEKMEYNRLFGPSYSVLILYTDK